MGTEGHSEEYGGRKVMHSEPVTRLFVDRATFTKEEFFEIVSVVDGSTSQERCCKEAIALY